MKSHRNDYSIVLSLSLAAILSLSVFSSAYALSPVTNYGLSAKDVLTSSSNAPHGVVQQDQENNKDNHGKGKGNGSGNANANADEDDENDKKNKGNGSDNHNQGKSKKVKIKPDRSEGGKVNVSEEGDEDDDSGNEDAVKATLDDTEDSDTFPADFRMENAIGIAVEKGKEKGRFNEGTSGGIYEVHDVTLDVTTIRVEGNHLRVSLDGEIFLDETRYDISDGKGIIIFFKNPGKNVLRGIIHITGTAFDSDSGRSEKMHLRAILFPTGDEEDEGTKWTFAVAPAAKLGPKLRIISLVGELTQIGDGGGDGGQPPSNPQLSRFVISNVPSSVQAGNLFDVTVTAVDSEGKVVKNYSGDARVTDMSETVRPVLLKDFKDGIFSGKLNITKATTFDKLTVKDVSTGKKGVSKAFNVTAGSIDEIKLSPVSATIKPGQKVSFKANLTDRFGNENSPLGKSFEWTLVPDVGSVTTSRNKAGYTAPESITVETSVKIAVRVNIASSTFVEDDSKITISPTAQQALDHFTIEDISGPKTAGEPFTVIITAIGTNDKPVISYEGAITLKDTTDTLSIVDNDGFSDGVWTGTVKITKTSDDVKITVKDSDSPSKKGTSTPFKVEAADLDHFAVTDIGNTQVAGEQFEFNVTALDEFENIITDYDGTIALDTNDGSSPAGNDNDISPSSYTFASADKGRHEFDATLYNAKTDVTISVSSADPQMEDTSSEFVVKPAALAEIIVTPDEISTAPESVVSLTAEAKDEFGNEITADEDTFSWSLSSSSLGDLDPSTGIEVEFKATTESITEPIVGSLTVTSGSVSTDVNITITAGD